MLYICVCILFVGLSSDWSLYTSQNKGNVYNYTGFHLLDALSWLPSWTGVVSYKMYVSGCHVFFFFFSRAGDGSDGEEVEEEDARILSGFLLAWGTAVALCVSYSLHSRKTISTVSSGECFVRSCYGLRCISGTLFLNRKRRWE